jgi:hypothetical protein
MFSFFALKYRLCSCAGKAMVPGGKSVRDKKASGTGRQGKSVRHGKENEWKQ